VRLREGVIEVAGGRLAAVAGSAPQSLQFLAITFGHVVLGLSHAVLARERAHEHVHVRQYETWGVLFFPLYLGSSAWQLLMGRSAYGHNWFERRAFGLIGGSIQVSSALTPYDSCETPTITR
jgi:hypothetical protein